MTTADTNAQADAVKEAIVEDHPMWCRLKRDGNEHAFDEDGICKCGADVYGVNDALVTALAEANKRAEVATNMYDTSVVNRKALTRQLETAKAALRAAYRRSEFNTDEAVRILRDALAAIDAPAPYDPLAVTCDAPMAFAHEHGAIITCTNALPCEEHPTDAASPVPNGQAHRLVYEDAEDKNYVTFICACGWKVQATAYGAELAFDRHCKDANGETSPESVPNGQAGGEADDGDDLPTRIARYCENQFTDDESVGSFKSVVDGIRDLLPFNPHADCHERERWLRDGVRAIIRRMSYAGDGTDARGLAIAVQEDLAALLAEGTEAKNDRA